MRKRKTNPKIDISASPNSIINFGIEPTNDPRAFATNNVVKNIANPKNPEIMGAIK